MSNLILAANWKMHHGPRRAGAFMVEFLKRCTPIPDREVWFFPPAASLATVAHALRDRPDTRAGGQNIHWESKGAFTGEQSVDILKEAGGRSVLVGHSERRHVFGETDAETGRKVRAALAGGIAPMLCVGETLAQREAGETLDVVKRQLNVLDGLQPDDWLLVTVAYEPVWAIGTGKNATPRDAAEVHAAIRTFLAGLEPAAASCQVLDGGSVKPNNAIDLVAEEEIDGVLVGGASLEPDSWIDIVRAGLD